MDEVIEWPTNKSNSEVALGTVGAKFPKEMDMTMHPLPGRAKPEFAAYPVLTGAERPNSSPQHTIEGGMGGGRGTNHSGCIAIVGYSGFELQLLGKL
jgi:hypothetical protein